MMVHPRSQRRGIFSRLAHLKENVHCLVIEGDSMAPTLLNGQYVLLDDNYYSNNSIQRSDIIAFRNVSVTHKLFIKRVIGLPGEFLQIKGKKILIDGTPLKEPYVQNQLDPLSKYSLVLEDEEYFVLGDNRQNSLDSRKFAGIHTTSIVGLIWFQLWPPKLL